MKTIKAFASELWGLFVDDGALAVGLLVWCAAAFVLPAVLPQATVDAVVFFVGCLVVLLVNVATAALRARPVRTETRTTTTFEFRGGDNSLP